LFRTDDAAADEPKKATFRAVKLTFLDVKGGNIFPPSARHKLFPKRFEQRLFGSPQSCWILITSKGQRTHADVLVPITSGVFSGDLPYGDSLGCGNSEYLIAIDALTAFEATAELARCFKENLAGPEND
jgi:hypothetical protein